MVPWGLRARGSRPEKSCGVRAVGQCLGQGKDLWGIQSQAGTLGAEPRGERAWPMTGDPGYTRALVRGATSGERGNALVSSLGLTGSPHAVLEPHPAPWLPKYPVPQPGPEGGPSGR